MRNIKLQLVLAVALFLSAFTHAQTTYYVDQQNGSDASNGTSVSTAFETFDKAKNEVSAGDTIEIIGEYSNPSYNPNYTYTTEHDAHLWHAENTIRINNLNGSAGNYITIKAHNNSTVLKGDGGNIFRITNSSYLKIEDFNMEGEVDRIPLTTANNLQFVYIIDDGNLQGTVTAPDAADIKFRNLDETNDTDGIVEETDTYSDISNLSVKRPSYVDTRGFFMSNSENVIITNNTIHHTPGGGLRVSDSKFVDVIGNEIYRCSARSYSGTHALVVTRTEPIGSTDYSIKILKNLIHHNYNEQFSWAPDKTIITPIIDEGKGISLQRNNTAGWINGSGRILVANNLCYWNGFSGVHSNDGNRIDFINNTCYLNSYTNTVTYAGQTQQGRNIGVSAQGSDDIKMINNISVIDTDWNGYALAAGGTSNLFVSDNIIFGYNGTVSQDNDITSVETNTTIGNPLFINAGDHDAGTYDFGLSSNSPAIDIANTTFAPGDDYLGNSRDANPDIGAIEFISTLSVNDEELSTLGVFPNPFNNQITILHNNIESKNISLYNILGQKQSFNAQSNTNSVTLNLNHLPSGVYVLKMGSVTKKVIKK
ncbi:T9SS type A sorting domain-containing protein [Lacinutrix chionoecetis]